MKQKSLYHLLLTGMITLAAGLLSGCTEDLMTEVSTNQISFAVDNEDFNGQSPVTRGTKVSSVNSFGVSASVCGASSSYTTAGYGSYFFNEAATNGTSIDYFWPTADYKLSFFAYYPYGNPNFTVQSAANALGAPTYAYTVPSAIADQVDVMTAQNVNITGGSSSPVSLTFKHRCAAICFSVTNSRTEAVTLNSISIEGVKYSGTLREETWTLGSAVNSSSSNPFTLSYGSSIAANATVNVTGTTNIFLMLPQTIPAGAKVKISIDGEDPLEAELTGSWVAGKQYNYSLDIQRNIITLVVDEDSDIEDWEDQPFTLTALNRGTFTLTIPTSVTPTFLTSVSYSLDNGETWTTTANTNSNVVITTPVVEAGETVLWKSTGQGTSNSGNSYTASSIFSSTCQFAVSGNIMSLIYGDDYRGKKTLPNINLSKFAHLFYNNKNIIFADGLILPAETLGTYNYAQMFYGCEYLSTAPELPATTLADYCYQNMFYNCRCLKKAPTKIPATQVRRYSCQGMFSGCTALTTAPELPATTLWDYAYSSMFSNCTSLTTAPALSATSLAQYCCQNMFFGCTALTTAPATLPAPTLTSHCYDRMFYGCTNLTTPPVLSFTRANTYSCQQMFGGCTALTTAPELPATTLGQYCYSQMFDGCTALTTAPELNATTLQMYCYSNMFINCSSLTTAPELPATTLANSCYVNMFQNCTSLTTAPELPAMTMVNGCYSGMFNGCTSLTTAPELPATTLANSCYNGMFQNCTSLTTTPELPVTTLDTWCYNNMFYGCTALTTAPELPATTMKQRCYTGMFANCKSLTTAPELPATTLANNCYEQMFLGCSSLTTAPELPATTLTDNCYMCMFQNCTSLTTAPELPATTLANSCYNNMFNSCWALTTPPELPATTLANNCYNGMFQGCRMLTTAPELNATTLTNSCYSYMFQACYSLTTAPELPATTLAESCYNNMFNSCSALSRVPAILPATTLTNNCYSNMFSSCKSLTIAPELPATTLVNGCYNNMFQGCSSLIEVKAAFTTPPSSSYTSYWLYQTTSYGTFYKNAAATWNDTSNNGVPSTWKKNTYIP